MPPLAHQADRVAAVKRDPLPLIVVVFCDGGEQYWSERYWENPPEGASVGGTN